GLPRFGTFFGTAGLESAAKESGYWWIWIMTAVVAIGTGGAVLRAAGRIFLGLGQGVPPADRRDEDHVERPSPISHVMTAPAIALLAIAAVVGMSHGFRDGAMQ